jgi:hypothetical protein
MQMLGDSVLAVWDVGSSRVSYFSASGAFKTSATFATASRLYASNVFGIAPDGTIYLKALLQRPVPQQPWKFGYVRLTPAGKIIDSVALVSDESTGAIRGVTPNGARTNFLPSTISVLYPLGGLVSARSDRYAITVTGSALGRALVIERRHTPVPLRGEERAEWEALAREFEAVSKRPPARGLRPDDPYLPPALPDVKPPFRDVVPDADGRIWVELNSVAEKHALPPRSQKATGPIQARISWFDRTVFDVFGRDGKFLGQVTLPPKSVFLAARGNRVWAQSTGPNDEEVIVAYRINGRGL